LAKSGANKPQSKSRPRGLLAILFVLITVAVIVNHANEPGSTKSAKDDAKDDSCRSEWIKCADNEQLVNQYSDWSLVQVRCERAATDQARYGSPDWPWLPFGTFHKGTNYVTTGIAVAIEPDAQFSNGFGAKVHSRVTCTYDLRAKRVTDVSISPR
jgi:hypothetical protein